MPQPMNPDSAEHVKRCPTPPSRMGLPNVAHLPRAARRAAPRQHVALLLACTWEAPAPGRPAPTQQPPTRHAARVPPAEDRRLEASALATVRGLFVRGCSRRTRSPRARGRGEDHNERPRGEARRGATRAESPSDDRVRRCGAPSSTEQRSRRGDRTVRGARAARGRRADEPAAREEERGRGVCASKAPRPGAVESWSRARRRQAARAHAGCREPPSPAAQERG